MAETTNYNGTIAYKDFTITQASQPTTTYYWYVGYDQNAYEHPESFKANMYTTTTNAIPTQYSKSGDNGYFLYNYYNLFKTKDQINIEIKIKKIHREQKRELQK